METSKTSTTYIIKQLRFRKGKPMCHKPDGRSWQQAHYKQGDLDSACGAYSIAMALNLIGVFDADVFTDDEGRDGRTRAAKLVKRIDESHLYSNGLTREEVYDIINDSFGTIVTIESTDDDHEDTDILDFTIERILDNKPVILGIDWSTGGGHWVVAVGVEYDFHGEILGICVLDPSEDAPSEDNWRPYLIPSWHGRSNFKHRYIASKNSKVGVFAALSVGRKRP